MDFLYLNVGLWFPNFLPKSETLLGVCLILIGAFFSRFSFRGLIETCLSWRSFKGTAACCVGGWLCVLIGGVYIIFETVVDSLVTQNSIIEKRMVKAMANAQPLLSELVIQSRARLEYLERIRYNPVLNPTMDDGDIEEEKDLLRKLNHLQELISPILPK